MIAEPLGIGAANDRVAVPGATSTDGDSGVSGTAGTATVTSSDHADQPTRFSARTLQS